MKICEQNRADSENKLYTQKNLNKQKKCTQDQLVASLEDVIKNKGETIVRIFDAIHAAKRGPQGGSRIASIYKEGGKAALNIINQIRPTTETTNIMIINQAIALADQQEQAQAKPILIQALDNILPKQSAYAAVKKVAV